MYSMPFSDVTNSQQRSYFSGQVTSAVLNRYFTDYVTVDREKTQVIAQEVLPCVEELLAEVNDKDKRYGKEIIRVGSSTQGLNVNKKGDFDFSVLFKLQPDEPDDHESNKLHWTDDESTPMMYGFKDSDMNDPSSPRQDVEIVCTRECLPHPGPGYVSVGLTRPYDGFDGLQFNGDLIPHLVKTKFKCLLQKATDKRGLKDDLKLSKSIHGPALTFKTKVKTSDGEVHGVGIDLAVIIRAQLPFRPEMGWPDWSKFWPRPEKFWPSLEKTRFIMKMGINIVAKKPFFWQLSFAELEKELVREIDKDGGCRKVVHRIMKSVFYTVCKEDAALSSYMLKNVWFLEMEKHPDPRSWERENLAERYCGYLQSLLNFVHHEFLPQYFDRRVNLLKMDKLREISCDVEKIQSFRFDKGDQRKRPANDTLPYKHLKKFTGATPNW